LAVGYCTLYGDMAGGLAVISDVPKLMVYELAKWINREREFIPVATIDKPPSAELRPDQKDEDSLPPYDVLDRILKLYIEDLKSPQEIADRYDFDLKLVKDIALLVDRNEYKRKQSAPGLKITSRALDLAGRFQSHSGLFHKVREGRGFCEYVIEIVDADCAIFGLMGRLWSRQRAPGRRELRLLKVPRHQRLPRLRQSLLNRRSRRRSRRMCGTCMPLGRTSRSLCRSLRMRAWLDCWRRLSR